MNDGEAIDGPRKTRDGGTRGQEVPMTIDVEAKFISSRKRDKDLNLEALETLVVTFGPREAARQSGINVNTVLSLAARNHWKRAKAPQTNSLLVAPSQSKNGGKQIRLHSSQKTNSQVQSICNQSPGKALGAVLARLKTESTTNLALYSAKASKAALSHKKPLDISRKVKDVADIHRTLWPTEAESKNILQIGFIISGK